MALHQVAATDIDATEGWGQSTSSLYSVLPSLVRSRIPVLASLRQTAREVVTQPLLPARSISAQTYTPCSGPQSGNRRGSTSDMGATISTTSSGTSTPLHVKSEGDNQALTTLIRFDVDSARQNIHVGGVDWLVAGAGVRLWLSAKGQAELGAKDPALLRSMHVDALRYMNMALPTDLSRSEIETIRASLPYPIIPAQEHCEQLVIASRPNMLRKGVAHVVCWIVAFIVIVIPLVMTALNRLLIYEREHRVTQRMLASSADFTKALGERGIDFGNAFVQFKDTPIGKASLDAVAWIMEGIAGGLNDGLVLSINGRAGSAEQRSKQKSLSSE